MISRFLWLHQSWVKYRNNFVEIPANYEIDSIECVHHILLNIGITYMRYFSCCKIDRMCGADHIEVGSNYFLLWDTIWHIVYFMGILSTELLKACYRDYNGSIYYCFISNSWEILFWNTTKVSKTITCGNTHDCSIKDYWLCQIL